jgi:type IV pilus assembly protein PilA
MTRRRAQSGFTFIELMAVVAIMGILVALVMPSIKNYTLRAKVAEAILALTNCRTSVSEIYQSGSPIPPTDWGCNTGRSQYVDAIEVIPHPVNGDGIIRVFTSPTLGDSRVAIQYITLTPMARSGQRMSSDDEGTAVFRWRCGNSDDGTTITEVSFLPSSCRGG